MANSDSKAALKADKDKLKEDLQEIISDAQSLLKESTDNLVGDKVEAARERLGKTREKMRDKGEAVAEKTCEYKQSVESSIQDNPWAAAGIALGAGVLIGILSRR